MTSSAEDDWSSRLEALEEYKSTHGHCHVGFSSEDPAELTRFARMQRAAFKKGSLSEERQVKRVSKGNRLHWIQRDCLGDHLPKLWVKRGGER